MATPLHLCGLTTASDKLSDIMVPTAARLTGSNPVPPTLHTHPLPTSRVGRLTPAHTPWPSLRSDALPEGRASPGGLPPHDDHLINGLDAAPEAPQAAPYPCREA
ncbi:hypothetical protein GCM10010486_52770 [Nonomuraea roseoviolacea subsp. carminata]